MYNEPQLASLSGSGSGSRLAKTRLGLVLMFLFPDKYANSRVTAYQNGPSLTWLASTCSELKKNANVARCTLHAAVAVAATNAAEATTTTATTRPTLWSAPPLPALALCPCVTSHQYDVVVPDDDQDATIIERALPGTAATATTTAADSNYNFSNNSFGLLQAKPMSYSGSG